MIRELVRRLQFTDDTTVDGNRLDGLMQAFVDRFNALAPRDIERNWTETVFVTGYQPVKSGETYSNPILPWMNPINLPTTIGGFPAVDPTPSYPTNEYRSKGYGVPWLPAGGTQYYWQWSSSFHVYRPTILTKIMVVMRTDNSDFLNSFIYGPIGTPPPGKNLGDYVDDFTIEVAIDNPFTQEDRTQANTEVLRTRFPASAWLMDADISTDMKPEYPTAGGISPKGVYVNLDVEIPVPQNARVRLNLVIPQYTGEIYNATWGETEPYGKQFYSMAISMLEKP